MPYYGERTCENKIWSGKNKGKQCKNYAYYMENKKYLCGVHSSEERKELPKNPDSKKIKEEKYDKEQKIIEEVAEKNRKNNKKGQVTVTKLKIMKKPEDIEGFLKIFPNFKHQNRKDGFGCSSLSPKAMGPIEHNMPHLPVAQNLENYHQFAKIFPFEIINGKITEEAKDIRVKAYESKIPHRHKYDAKKLKKYGNVNIPLYSLYYDKDGKEHKYTYIQCRYFYCHWYEKIAKETDDFKYLIDRLNKGYNLQIVGYDGFTPKNVQEHYLDEKRPFGHELVLYTLLTIDNPEEYPWNIFYKNNEELYRGVI